MLIQKLDIKGGQDEDNPGMEEAIVNLMKISLKRRDGNVITNNDNVKVDNIFYTIMKRYLMIEGMGRIAYQLCVGFATVLSSFFIDLWLITIAMGIWKDTLDIMPCIYIWGLISLFSAAMIFFELSV